MKTALRIGILICAGMLIIISTFFFVNRSKFDWAEGNSAISPDKNWIIYLQTGSYATKEYSKILVFKASDYPDLLNHWPPSFRQINNPTAELFLPIAFHARATDIKFPQKNRAVFSQDLTLNQLNYELNLENFSLSQSSLLPPAAN